MYTPFHVKNMEKITKLYNIIIIFYYIYYIIKLCNRNIIENHNRSVLCIL